MVASKSKEEPSDFFLAMSGIGTWEWNTKKLIWDDYMFTLYGLEKTTITENYPLYRPSIHPDEKDRVEIEVEYALDGKKDLDTSFKILLPDKSIRYLHVRGKNFFDSKKKIASIKGTAWDITKRKQLEKELQEKIRKVSQEKEIERMKSEFVSLAAHQLRTPLTSMNWYIELLENKDTGPLNEEQIECIENIHEESQRMTNLVEEFLNLARIESGKLKQNLTLTDPTTFITKTIQECHPLAHKKNIKLVFEKPSQKMDSIQLDKILIHQVIHNLITNAIKYASEKTTIIIRAKDHKQSLIIQVSNKGIGIPKSVQPRIFEKFFRADNAVSVQTDGSGLGLHIAKNIIEDAGGKIWFTSEEGKETIFSLSLPRKNTTITTKQT